MGGGGSTQGTLAAKSDSYDFELAPYLMGWQYEEKFRTKGLSIHDFDLGENIGISMYGVVRLAKHTPTGVWVAVKCLHKREIIRLKQVPSVQIEKEVMMHLNHPFIARSGGATQDANMLYLTVELGAGGDMLSHLHRQPKRRLEESDARFYLSCVAMAIMYMHNRDLILRALNPENLVMDASGYIKVVDFQQCAGLVDRPNKGRNPLTGRRLTKRDAWTTHLHPGPELTHKLEQAPLNSVVYQHSRRRVVPHYFAPEVIECKRHGKSSDWYSFGVLMYEFLCGYTPYFDSSGPGLSQKILRESIQYPVFVMPVAVEMMAKLLEKDWHKRLGHNNTEEVITHKWFRRYPFQRLLYRRIRPPYTPNLLGPSDTKYYLKLDNDVSKSTRFADGGVDAKAVGSAFHPYDSPNAPPLSQLPPRHCMYGITPGAKNLAPVDDEGDEGWGEEDGAPSARRGGMAGEQDDEVANPLGDLKEEEQQVLDRLVEGFGGDPVVILGMLKKNRWDEDKVATKLEEMNDKVKSDDEDDDRGGD